MSGIRYININNLPRDLSEENRQFVTQLVRSAPKPIYLLMIHPFQWIVSPASIQALETRIPDDVLRELRLLQGRVFEASQQPEISNAKFLLAVEDRIGKKARAEYEDLLLTECLDPISGQLVPAEIPPLSTKALELVIGAVHKVLSQILTRNSNACTCAEEYKTLERQRINLLEIFGTGGISYQTGKDIVERANMLIAIATKNINNHGDYDVAAEIIEKASRLLDQGTKLAMQGMEEVTSTGNLSKTALEKKLQDIDSIIKTRWGKDVPARYAEHLDQGPCPHCRKPRQLDETLTLATPQFLNNLFNIALGGEMPLVSLLPFVESVFSQIYNPDMIPESKKKDMQAFTEKIQLQRILDTILNKILDIFGIPHQPITLTPSGVSMPNTKSDSTGITPTDGDLPRMTLTDNFHPVSETGSTTNIAKDESKNETT